MITLIFAILTLPFIGAWLYGVLESFKESKADLIMFGRCVLLTIAIGSFILLMVSYSIDLLSSMIVNKWFEMLLKIGDLSA